MSRPGEWQAGMREISGFGGSYEETCRTMLRNGIRWLEAEVDADPDVREIPGIYGATFNVNAAAEDLRAAVLEGVEDSTGAQLQAVMNHLLYINQHGWRSYVREMRK